ncbi:hypothetical protein FCL49_10535 [Serratia proteamaculans]|nr:hypothetical protein [Serratia proteamaculans]NTZ28536.1 hypothetical protein [Serratia proteamaculans]
MKLFISPRYSGLAHRGALRRASRYDPFGTLSLIIGFVRSLGALNASFVIFYSAVFCHLPETPGDI